MATSSSIFYRVIRVGSGFLWLFGLTSLRVQSLDMTTPSLPVLSYRTNGSISRHYFALFRWKICYCSWPPKLTVRQIGWTFIRDNLGEGNCDSKIAARQWGVNVCREAFRGLAGHSGRWTYWIYIYIYVAITSISGQKKGQIFNFPQFYSKKWPRKTPTPSVGVFHVSMFCLLSHLCLFCLIFSSFPLLLDFLKSKSGPLNEVLYIYICIFFQGREKRRERPSRWRGVSFPEGPNLKKNKTISLERLKIPHKNWGFGGWLA